MRISLARLQVKEAGSKVVLNGFGSGIGILNEEGPFYTQLLEVLEAFALFNPTIAYVSILLLLAAAR